MMSVFSGINSYRQTDRQTDGQTERATTQKCLEWHEIAGSTMHAQTWPTFNW